jgi:Large polyvalent protein-associated domain 7
VDDATNTQSHTVSDETPDAFEGGHEGVPAAHDLLGVARRAVQADMHHLQVEPGKSRREYLVDARGVGRDVAAQSEGYGTLEQVDHVRSQERFAAGELHVREARFRDRVERVERLLASLRSRRRRTQRLEDAVLTAENADQARHIVHEHMKPAIRRDGRVIYRVTDGGVVSDEAAYVRVPQPTTAAAFLALSLAADRFGSRPLTVNGTEAFRTQVASVAGIEGMSVTFADPGLEKLRARGRAASTQAFRRGRAAPDIDQGR